MKKILIIVLIILFLVLPLFAEEAKKPIIKYKVPEVTLLISDGVAFIYRIGGLQYIFIIHQSGAALIQMQENDKDGKVIMKKCECENI